ncbi:hypothetical protein PsorP6_001549 [Peronosclerospora sorghi]|uniref:Uncharacterized protein n=1 Tax=Peronosclerospora sorghi TaxID=230839 RepID=A0ACC0WPN8_9STRA|nr:hypothetical protein PsorP6_001549 [Peronosclerospora sorghi]
MELCPSWPFAAKDFDQAIVAVGLVACPATGVFTTEVRHVLVVAMAVEVVLLAVVADDNQPERAEGTVLVSYKLQRTQLSVSTDKCVDGALYEILYATAQKAAAYRNSLLGAALTNVAGVGTSDGCRKIVHASTYAQYLPKFLAGLSSAPGKVVVSTTPVIFSTCCTRMRK